MIDYMIQRGYYISDCFSYYKRRNTLHLPNSAQCSNPRFIIHGGAGNIRKPDLPADKYEAYRSALLSIVCEIPTAEQCWPAFAKLKSAR